MKVWPVFRIAVAAVAAGGALYLVIAGSLRLDVRILVGVIIAQPPALAALVLMAWRTRFLASNRVSFWSSLSANALGIVAAYVAPLRASEGAKVIYLRAMDGLPVSKGFTIIIIERLTDIACVALMIGVLILAQGAWAGYGAALVGMLGVLIVATGLAIVVTEGRSTVLAWVSRIPWPALQSFFASTIMALVEIGSMQRIARTFIFAALSWGASYALYLGFFAGAAVQVIPPIGILAIFLITTLGLTAAVLPAGFGTFEAAMIVALAPFGIEAAEALVLAVGLRITTLFVPALITLGLLLGGRLAWRELRAPPPADDHPGHKT